MILVGARGALTTSEDQAVFASLSAEWVKDFTAFKKGCGIYS